MWSDYKLPTGDTLDTNTLKVKECKNIYHANSNHKKAVVAILISDKIDIKTKSVTRDKEGLTIKESTHQEQ